MKSIQPEIYLRAFGLREHAFGPTPDRRFLYLSDSHREALASLLHGIESGCGLMSLIAEPGAGKTTILSEVLHQTSERVRSIWLFQTQCTRVELLRYMLSDSGLPSSSSDVVILHRLFTDMLVRNHHQGRKTLLIVDEAQNLADDVLESVRLLSDIETEHSKLLQIVLAGQPPLASQLTKGEQLQLRQRISIAAQIAPLDADGVQQYIGTRLAVAGRKAPLFANEAIAEIATESGGIPRVINNFCFNLLPLAYAMKRTSIEKDLVEEVARDLAFRRTEAVPGSAGSESQRPLTEVRGPGNWQEAQSRKSAELPIGVSGKNIPDSDRASVALNAWGEPIPNHSAATTSDLRASPVNRASEVRNPSIQKNTLNHHPFAATTTDQSSRPNFTKENGAWRNSTQVAQRKTSRPPVLTRSISFLCLIGCLGAVCIGAFRSSQQQPSEAWWKQPSDTRWQNPKAKVKNVVQPKKSLNNPLNRNASVKTGTAPKRQTPRSTSEVPSTKATYRQSPGLENISVDVSDLTLDVPPKLNLLSPEALQPRIVRVLDPRSHLVYSVPPEYPSSAIVAHLQGAVVLDTTIGKDGLVADVKVLSGHELLARPAAAAVKQWRFRPYLLGGSPVEVKTTVNLQFSLKPRHH